MCFGISIHALLAESDPNAERPKKFYGYFYPRSPCGERPRYYDGTTGDKGFLSTLSLRRATESIQRCIDMMRFLSTLSLRRATVGPRPCGPARIISIHALLAESDLSLQNRIKRHNNFYPRSPCGERPILGNPCAGCPAISIHALLAESDLTMWTAAT